MDRYKVFPSGELGMHPTGNWTPYADAQAAVEALQRERDQWREAFERLCADAAHLKAALTATSQPERRCPDCQSPYAQCQAWRAQGKIACCPDCRHDATSQEGQHGSRT